MENTDPTLIEKAPNDPWSALAWWMQKYCITRDGEGKTAEEEASEFLSAGPSVKLPQLITVNDERSPYRLYPITSYRIINACVKVLEKQLETEIAGESPSPEEETKIAGIMTLANLLFGGACTHPDGQFTIHRMDPIKKRPVLNPHGRRVKQLAVRLEKYSTTRTELAARKGQKLELPTLSCREIINQEINNSLQIWKIVDGENWDGRNPGDLSDSLDSLKQNLGFEATVTAEPLEDDFPDTLEIQSQEIAQSAWTNLNLPFNLRFQETQRGNILASSPLAWLWNFEEDPLTFVVDYVSSHAKPCLEEAHSLLLQAHMDPKYKEVGSLALILDPKNKNNPDSYWKIIKRLSQHFSSSQTNEPESTLKKLDCARFTLCLETTNRNLGIDPEEFSKAFHEKVRAILADPALRDTVTRNQILLDTLLETKDAQKLGWGKREGEQWLEHLQSTAVGAYENSIGMENERRKLLTKLNHLFKTPREELEKASKNPTENVESIEKIHGVIASAANAFYSYLSGRTGQMTRRELRTKIYSLKTSAAKRGDRTQEEKLATMGKFVASISSQIKSGEWYTKEKENKSILFDFLIEMLRSPKTNELEFPGSTEPEAKDPLDITIDFLKAFSGETEHPTGSHNITFILELCRTRQLEDEGGQLAAALTKITKNRVETLPAIKDRKTTLEGAIEISNGVHQADDPFAFINTRTQEETEILTFIPTEERPEPFSRHPGEPVPPAFDTEGNLAPIGETETALQWLEFETLRIQEANKDGKMTAANMQDAHRAINAGTLILQGLPENSPQLEQRALSTTTELKREVNLRLEKNLSFWKGMHYISQNIQSRREPEKYQISPTGRGTLQNLIAIAKAKLQNKELTGRTIGSTDAILKQFQLTRTRERTIAPNISIPLALWLSEKEKGTKTKITQEDFVKMLESRHHACILCLNINENDRAMQETLNTFQERELDDKNALNTSIINNCITMLENQEELTAGLRWQNSHPKELAKLGKQHPELDTPIMKIRQVQTKKKTKEIETILLA